MIQIAVWGAVGYLGGYAVTCLWADGHQVRAVVRSPKRKRASLLERVKVVRDAIDIADWIREVGAPPTSFAHWIAQQRDTTTERSSS